MLEISLQFLRLKQNGTTGCKIIPLGFQNALLFFFVGIILDHLPIKKNYTVMYLLDYMTKYRTMFDL